jgi:hypothetical protein
MNTSYGRFFLQSPVVVLLLLLMACAGPPRREAVTSVQAHMYAHFDRAGEVHDALVRGQLDRARAAAHWLATHEEPGMLPVDSDRHIAAMISFARQASEAPGLGAAAVAAAQMGRVCGDCHRDLDVSPRFLLGTVAPEGAGPKAEMARHIWASDRMWQGLIAPDDFAWSSGARGLTLGWLNPGEVVASPGDRERLRSMIQQVYDLAAQAEAAEEPEDRAEVYGTFLTTCIDCHQLTEAIIR